MRHNLFDKDDFPSISDDFNEPSTHYDKGNLFRDNI